MTFKEVFEGIQSFTEEVLFAPFEFFRLGTESWTFSNIINWLLMIIGFVAMVYWMLQLKKFNDNDEENRSQTSHGFLGDVPKE